MTTPTPSGAGPGPAGSAQIEKKFEEFFNSRGIPFKGTDFDGRSDYGPSSPNGIPAGGLFTGAEGIKTAAEVALWGGTAGQQYDPCYHAACDTFDNVNLVALDTNSDAIAYATLSYAMSTEEINGVPGQGQLQATATRRGGDAGRGVSEAIQPKEKGPRSGPFLVIRSAGLAVHGVLTAPPAVFLHLETVGRIGLVLGGDVVATLALGAGERQRRSLVAWHRLALLDDLYDSAGADGAATFSDGETESFVHGDGCNQFHSHFRIVPGHDHLSPLG